MENVMKMIFKKTTMVSVLSTLFVIGMFFPEFGGLLFTIFIFSTTFSIMIEKPYKLYLSKTKNENMKKTNIEEISLKLFFRINYTLLLPIVFILILSFLTNNLWTKEKISLNNEKIELLISSYQIKESPNDESSRYSSLSKIVFFVIKIKNFKPIDHILNTLSNHTKISWELGKNGANLINEYHSTKNTKTNDKS